MHKQRDGRNYVGVAPASGRVSGTTLIALADAAERAGSGRVRLTPQQKIVVLDVPDAAVEPLIGELDALGLQAEPSPWRRATMACTGIEFCKLAIVETKERAIRLVEDLEKRLADVHPDVPISIHLNGCPNACARTQVADIGLKGQIVTDAEGNQVEGFQVHLGGGLGPGLRVRPQAARAQGHQRRAGRLRRPGRAPLRRAAHRGRAVRAVGAAGRRGRPEVSAGNV